MRFNSNNSEQSTPSRTVIRKTFHNPPQPSPDRRQIEAWIIDRLARKYELAPGEIDPHQPMTDYGLDSLDAFQFAGDLVQWLHRDLPVHLLWEHASAHALAERLAEELQSGAEGSSE